MACWYRLPRSTTKNDHAMVESQGYLEGDCLLQKSTTFYKYWRITFQFQLCAIPASGKNSTPHVRSLPRQPLVKLWHYSFFPLSYAVRNTNNCHLGAIGAAAREIWCTSSIVGVVSIRWLLQLWWLSFVWDKAPTYDQSIILLAVLTHTFVFNSNLLCPPPRFAVLHGPAPGPF